MKALSFLVNHFEDIINSFMLFVTMCGIILTYFSLKEMVKQNKLQVIPCLIVHDIESVVIKRSNSKKRVEFIVLMLKELEDKFYFEVENIGNGVAENIEVSVKIGENLITNRYVHDENEKLIFQYGNNEIFYEHNKENYISFVQILKNEGVYILKDLSFFNMIEVILITMCLEQSNDLYKINPIFEINLNYCDILGNKYSKTYDAFIENHNSFFGKKREEKFSIRFHKKR